MRIATTIAAAGLCLPSALAVLVARGSHCENKCGNNLDDTPYDQIVCDEDAPPGVFKDCVTCESRSTFVQDKETDLKWALYNLRKATGYCLFGYPENKDFGTNPCITSTACEPLKDAITFNNLTTSLSSFDYCALWVNPSVGRCLNCVRAWDDHHRLANYITIMDTACQQQPVPGKTIAYEGEVFSSDVVNATDPSPIPTLPPDYFKQPAFSIGAKVGVAFGGLAFVLAIAGCCVVWTGKRRRRSFLKRMEERHGHKGWTGHVNNADMHETPVSQRPLRGWDDSPMSATTEQTFPRYFSPYSSQYNSPVSAVEGPSMQWPEKAQTHDIGVALGGDESSGHFDPPSPAKGKEKDESYEMHEVDSDHSSGRGRMPAEPEPPVLHHPGFGRASGSPPRFYGLTEEDARRGNAV